MATINEDAVLSTDPVKFIFTCFDKPRTWVLVRPESYQNLRDPSPYFNTSGYRRIMGNEYETREAMLWRLICLNHTEFVRNLATYGMDLSSMTPEGQEQWKDLFDGVFEDDLFEEMAFDLKFAEEQQVVCDLEGVVGLLPVAVDNAPTTIRDESEALSLELTENVEVVNFVTNLHEDEPTVLEHRCSAKKATYVEVERPRLVKKMNAQDREMQSLYDSQIQSFSNCLYRGVNGRMLLKALLDSAPGRLEVVWEKIEGRGFRSNFLVPDKLSLNRVWEDAANAEGVGRLSSASISFLLHALGYGHDVVGKDVYEPEMRNLMASNFPEPDIKILRRQAFRWPSWAFDTGGQRFYLQHLHCDYGPYQLFNKLLSEAVDCGGNFGFDGKYGFYVEKVKRQPWFSSKDFVDHWKSENQPYQ